MTKKLELACKYGIIDKVIILLRVEGIDIEAKGDYGFTLLHLVCANSLC